MRQSRDLARAAAPNLPKSAHFALGRRQEQVLSRGDFLAEGQVLVSMLLCDRAGTAQSVSVNVNTCAPRNQHSVASEIDCEKHQP
jgi:hypothetical protein